MSPSSAVRIGNHLASRARLSSSPVIAWSAKRSWTNSDPAGCVADRLSCQTLRSVHAFGSAGIAVYEGASLDFGCAPHACAPCVSETTSIYEPSNPHTASSTTSCRITSRRFARGRPSLRDGEGLHRFVEREFTCVSLAGGFALQLRRVRSTSARASAHARGVAFVPVAAVAAWPNAQT
jgi:hypothetical protein